MSNEERYIKGQEPKEDTCECNIYMEFEELCARCQEVRGGEND